MLKSCFQFTFDPHEVYEGVEEDLEERDHLGKDQPHIDHLHVGSRWEGSYHG